MIGLFLFSAALILICLSYFQHKRAAHNAPIEQVAAGVYRGSQPGLKDYMAMKEMGIKTVLNLREKSFANEELDLVESFGFQFINLPMTGELYPLFNQVDYALEYLTAPNFQPVFVHCAHGKDRTGCVIGMYRRKVQGWSKWDAWKEMWAHGFNPGNIGVFLYYLIH
jgi:tyrosine-protein phosphatase SIW14